MTVAKTCVLVLDCTEPESLAEFYARLLNAETRRGSDPDYVEIIGHAGVRLAIRRDHGLTPPSWPRPEDAQQAHLQVLVPKVEMDAAEREVIGLGATPVDARDNSGPRDVRVYSDPAGHSFMLVAGEGRLGE
ncbi:VOC family protein [Streptomyces sp. NPDC051776]|uniref:VOC family protein n=1 Tax=Streptomyces sp. NPDC051776 TaxID=3155414 RepID=UPI0034264776